jgi:hypothetical protein
MSIEKSNDLIRNRTRHLPACSIVPQPSELPRDPSGFTYLCIALQFVCCVFPIDNKDVTTDLTLLMTSVSDSN